MQLDYKKECDGLLYEHAWIPSDGLSISTKFAVKTIKIASKEYKYIPVFARVDIPQVSSEFLSQVPKEIAISHSLNPVIFIEVNNRIHVIISASSTCFSRIRTNLMKFFQTKANIWGHVDYQGNKLDKDFFYWLLSKKGKKITSNTEVYQIIDVEGFKSHTDKELQKFQGSGASIDTVAPFKAMVCLQNDFTGLDLVIKNQDNITICFSISNNWEMKLDKGKTFKIENGQVIFIDDIKDIIFLLYLHVIPKLYGEYQSDKLWSDDRVQFRKQVAAQAINELLAETGLTLPDLGKLLA